MMVNVNFFAIISVKLSRINRYLTFINSDLDAGCTMCLDNSKFSMKNTILKDYPNIRWYEGQDFCALEDELYAVNTDDFDKIGDPVLFDEKTYFNIKQKVKKEFRVNERDIPSEITLHLGLGERAIFARMLTAYKIEVSDAGSNMDGILKAGLKREYNHRFPENKI